MKIRLLLPCVAFAFTASSALVAQEAPPPGPGGPGGGRPPQKQTELGAKMEKMGSDWKKLKKQLADPAEKEAALKAIAAMKAASQEMAKLTPPALKTVAEADVPKHNTEFVAKMKELDQKFDALAAAVKDGKADEATKIYGDIDQFQKDEHKEFRPQRQRGPGGPGGQRPPAPAQDKKD